jgi:hypothetical protein
VRHAIAWLREGPLATAQARMFCEVQLLLDACEWNVFVAFILSVCVLSLCLSHTPTPPLQPDTRTREVMHLYYKVKRADCAGALWRDFSHRVQPRPGEATEKEVGKSR